MEKLDLKEGFIEGAILLFLKRVWVVLEFETLVRRLDLLDGEFYASALLIVLVRA